MPPGGPDLLFDQVEIVEQPLAGGRDAMFPFDGRADELVGFEENSFVRCETGQQPVRTRMGVNLMPVRETFGMDFELRRIKQLLAERKIVAEIAKESVDSDPGLQTLQTVTQDFAVQVQFQRGSPDGQQRQAFRSTGVRTPQRCRSGDFRRRWQLRSGLLPPLSRIDLRIDPDE